MENAVNQLQLHYQAQNVPQPPQSINFQEMAAEQLKSVGLSLDPALKQLATVMATIQLKNEHDSKISLHLLQKTLLETSKIVTNNRQELVQLHNVVNQAHYTTSELKNSHDQLMFRVNQAEAKAFKANILAAETKQKSSKGNFIVPGDDLPSYRENENLYNHVFPLIEKKYGIHIQFSELKALHRLPNNRVLFSLQSRLPGQNFHKLIHAMNFNPNPGVKIYVSIQLFEPFSELYYIARRLKYYKCITNYRLDENGNTNIALI